MDALAKAVVEMATIPCAGTLLALSQWLSGEFGGLSPLEQYPDIREQTDDGVTVTCGFTGARFHVGAGRCEFVTMYGRGRAFLADGTVVKICDPTWVENDRYGDKVRLRYTLPKGYYRPMSKAAVRPCDQI